IANPNCSTIQLVLAISRMHQRYGIRSIVVSTYQSITGTGIKAIRQLEREEQQGCEGNYPKAYPYPIHRNLFPLGGDFLPNDYTTEEQKLVDESRKILRDADLQVCPTVVRVPVMGGHSESVNLELKQAYHLEEAKRLVAETPGVTLYDDPATLKFPMPLMAQGKDDVFVGRMRRDDTIPNGLCLWVVADNLRKGAATNAVEILQELINKRKISTK
ncbi:MAG: aspartate-semialdehyde dehydrogenase, partial [Bacteroidales bacterium]|nr:aspartate-semialdehyde dehydrogenase [Bacteroidales bacterium]